MQYKVSKGDHLPIIWDIVHPQARPANLGFLPTFILPGDPRPAVQQIEQRYAHGGGWYSLKKYLKLPQGTSPLDLDGYHQPLIAIATVPQSAETIRVYGDYVFVIQKSGEYDVARLD